MITLPAWLFWLYGPACALFGAWCYRSGLKSGSEVR